MLLSVQSIILIVVYALCILIGMIMFAPIAFQAKIMDVFITTSIITLIYVALLIYDTNCLTAGQCNVWSWIRTVLYLILPIIIIIAEISMIRQFRNAKDQS